VRDPSPLHNLQLTAVIVPLEVVDPDDDLRRETVRGEVVSDALDVIQQVIRQPDRLANARHRRAHWHLHREQKIPVEVEADCDHASTLVGVRTYRRRVRLFQRTSSPVIHARERPDQGGARASSRTGAMPYSRRDVSTLALSAHPNIASGRVADLRGRRHPRRHTFPSQRWHCHHVSAERPVDDLVGRMGTVSTRRHPQLHRTTNPLSAAPSGRLDALFVRSAARSSTYRRVYLMPIPTAA
jgi:hypothetical protein